MADQASINRDYELSPVKFSRLSRRGVLLGLSGAQLVVVSIGAVVLVFALYFGGGPSLVFVSPAPGAVRGARVGGRRRPQAHRVAPDRDALAVAIDRRATSVPSSDREASPGRDPGLARRRRPSSPVARPRERGRDGPRSPPGDVDGHRRRHAPGVHPARPDRAATTCHQLGTRARHRLPVRAHRLGSGDGADPAGLRQGPRRVVVAARQVRTGRGHRRPTANSSTAPVPPANATQAPCRSPSTSRLRAGRSAPPVAATEDLLPCCDKRWPP